MRKKFSYTLLALVGFLTVSSCKEENSSKAENMTDQTYEKYSNHVDESVNGLSPERKKKREDWINELKMNSTYTVLVNDKKVSAEYLPILSAISDAIKNSYVEDGVSLFGISEDAAKHVEMGTNGVDKMKFVVSTASLSLKMNGGMPVEIVKVFDRYRRKFNLTGQAGDLVIDNSGNKTKIEYSFNLGYAFLLFDPSDKKGLNAIFESVENGISEWNDPNEVVYDNGFMSLKSEYMKHLKEVYPDSPYLLDVDFEITPDDLYASYSANEVAADEKFKNKKLAITGTITDIGKDISDKAYVSFKVDDFKNVACYFNDENINAISKLSKGELVTVVGECKGLTLINVIIQDCEIH